jgi:hypothetical protein
MNVQQAMAYNELCPVRIIAMYVPAQTTRLAHCMNNVPAWFCDKQAGWFG